ncbi:UDB17 glucuronosyltransferase, partial [Pseudoatta argentina]
TNLIKELLRKGHHVHVISTHETKVKGKLAQNLTYDVLDGLMKAMEESEKDYNPIKWERYSAPYVTYSVYQWKIYACDTVVKTKAAEKLLEMIKIVQFDIILQKIVLNECLYGLWEIAKGKPPIVGYIPYSPAPWLNDLIGGLSYTVFMHIYQFHPAFEYGIPLPPNTLEIAGLNAQAIKPIDGEIVVTYPEDIRTFLDKSILTVSNNLLKQKDYILSHLFHKFKIINFYSKRFKSHNIYLYPTSSSAQYIMTYLVFRFQCFQRYICLVSMLCFLISGFFDLIKYSLQYIYFHKSYKQSNWIEYQSMSLLWCGTERLTYKIVLIYMMYNKIKLCIIIIVIHKFCHNMSSCFILLFHLVCCILISLVTTSKPLSILLIQPLPSPSHHIWTTNLIKGLLRKGHHVHVVSTHETKIKDKLAQNLTYDVFDGLMKAMEESEENYNPVEWDSHNPLYMIHFVYNIWGIRVCDTVIKTKTAKKLLEMIKIVEFDIILQDITLNECLYGLWEIAKGKPPIVGYIPYGPAPWLKDLIGGPSYPTVRPYTYLSIVKPIGLWQKTWNTVCFTVDDFIRHYYYLPIIQRLAEKYVGHTIRPLHEIEKSSINILLLNSHPAFDYGIPLPPNTLEIAGLNAQAIKPIDGEIVVTYPEDMRAFLDGAKNGVIIISLGTNVKWKFIGLNKVKTVLLALSKLKQRVLWKLDIEVPFEIPNNLMIVKWMPQNEVLSHKNVRAIWTHGGLLSAQEAIWKGVPMIVMPFYVDQKLNAQKLVAKDVGIYLDVKTLSTHTVLHAVEEILYNERYTRNMKQLSSEFRDRPIPPLDLAIWGIEFAVRHPNGTLVTPLRYQSWMEQNLIDVYAFLFFNFTVILLIIFLTIKVFIKFYYRIYTTFNNKLHKRKQA